ncbi:virion protein [Pseudocowpox virus]|uniref:Virion protein n=1 Tax=Pseudocowpox virus TaxID=129726 RepID=D3IZ82_9POXV|nr:virion protein [Pseudocowpox virus]
MAGSIYYCGGTHVVAAAPGTALVVLDAPGPVAAAAPAGLRVFFAEYGLEKKPGGPVTARLHKSGFRSAAGAWASAADFEAGGRPVAWTLRAEEAARVPLLADAALVLAWGARGEPLRVCVLARAEDAEAPVGAALKEAAFDARAPAAALFAALGEPALALPLKARLVTPPGAPPRSRLCTNPDMLRAFAVGWFGAQLGTDDSENEKVFAAFDRARSCLDDR